MRHIIHLATPILFILKRICWPECYLCLQLKIQYLKQETTFVAEYKFQRDYDLFDYGEKCISSEDKNIDK